MSVKTVLIVGGTGFLGEKIVKEALSQGFEVRALVRLGSDATSLEELGARIVRGDLTDPSSLGPALEGADAVVTSAIGYVGRKPGDSMTAVDDEGNRNLADAALQAGVQRFVFISVLSADKAEAIPHFHQKFKTEQYLEAIGLPFVALRPGAFLDQLVLWNYASIQQGVLPSIMELEAAITYVPSQEIARIAVACLSNADVVGQRIDVGMDRPASALDLSKVLSLALAQPVTPNLVPAGSMQDLAAYFNSGQYVADTAVQQAHFGPLLKLDTELPQLLRQHQQPVAS